MEYRLTLRLEEQSDGGYTITCQELPELLTECDSLDEVKANVIDAFASIVALYEYRGRPLPDSIKCHEDKDIKIDRHSYTNKVAIHELSAIIQNTQKGWL